MPPWGESALFIPRFDLPGSSIYIMKINASTFRWRNITVFLIVILSHSLQVSAQSMSVESFEPRDKDLTANTEPNIRYDLNGDKCALIKIQTTEHNFIFDVGSLGITEKIDQNAEHPAEIWLYVPNGVKSISIQHPTLGAIDNYDLGRSVKKGKTYLLKLTSDKVNTIVVDYSKSQYLKVSLLPKDAELFINGMKQSVTSEGKCEIPLAFGNHTYRVTAKDYHPYEDNIIINDPDNPHILNVQLKQAFGYVSVPATKNSIDAQVFVDDKLIGHVPVVNAPVSSGKHALKIYKKLFMPHEESFEMTDSAFMEFTHDPAPNSATISLSVAGDNDAEIYDNDSILGKGKWKGLLETGVHNIITKKEAHRSISKTITVDNGKNADYTLSAPTPIYGTIEINTTPQGAMVKIDGKEQGATPFTNDKILIGKHYATITLPKHRTENIEFDITEGSKTVKKLALTDYCIASVTTTPSYASLYINGERKETNSPLNLIAGEYNITVSASRYSPVSKKMRLDGNTKDFHIKLHRNYTRHNEFYLGAGYDILGMSGISFSMGGYIKRFNIEGSYTLPMAKSENIFWNDRNNENYPFVATYKPQRGKIKFGYGLGIGTRVRLTPQIGAQYCVLSETSTSLSDEYYSDLTAVTNASAISASVGARISVAISPCLKLTANPEYLIGVSKTDGFKMLSDLSSSIKQTADGFAVNAGICLFF